MTLDLDESDVCDYLKSWPKQFVSAAEVCRRAGRRKRYLRNPMWAYPVLQRLLDKGVVERDSNKHYRIILEREKESRRGAIRRYLSPQIRAILEKSGKPFDLDGQGTQDSPVME